MSENHYNLFQLTERRLQAEIMDDPELAAAEHAQALRGLERIHAVSRTTGRMWRSIRDWYERRRPSQLKVMDIGCGNAVLLRNLWKQASRHNIDLQLIGCDLSPRALELAQAACTARQIPIQLFQLDIRHDPLPVQADVLVCSLFLHHFSHDEVSDILKKLAAGSRGLLLIEDLIRSPLGYLLCQLGVHALSRSRVVHYDGPQSVRAAFSLGEMRRLLQAAGCTSATVLRCWPERLFVTYVSESEEPEDRDD